MKRKGLFWHVHHDTLVEWSDNIQERIRYIKRHKPNDEIPVRLKLLTPIKNLKELPEEIENNSYFIYYNLSLGAMRAIHRLHRKEHPNCYWNSHLGKINFNKRIRRKK